MRRACNETGLLGFCRKLTRDVFQLADPLNLASGGKLPKDCRKRSLKIETLEIRSMLSGTGLDGQVDSTWFQTVYSGDLNHAGTASWTAEGISSTQTQTTAATAAAKDTYDWIVQFDTQYLSGVTNVAQTVDLLTGGGIQFEAICGLGLVGQVLIRSTGSSLDTVEHWLAADEHVDAYEEDAVRQIESTPNDTSISQLWGMSKIDAYSAWNLSTGASGANRVVVAVIDTGVDYNHLDLAANIWTNSNVGKDGFGNDLHGYDFANNDADPMDDNGHGTHVAGTIGAVGNNSRGVAGVNWAVSIMPLKFMTSTGSGYLSDAIRAINYATMEKTRYGVNLRVINASWGGGSFSAAMQTAIQAAGNAGILFVAAAGNSGTNNDASPQYPSGYNCSNIVAVAATTQNDQLASFSCYGAASVDLAAPGVSIYSTLPGNRYGIMSGTSMATPEVAGAAALAWAFAPNASVADIKNALMQGVDRIGSLGGKVLSGGRLNVFHTLQLLQAKSSPTISLSSFTLSANNVTPGTAVNLVAQVPSAQLGNLSGVIFYADSNGSGTLDAQDTRIGTVWNPAGGTAKFTINTTGSAAGVYRYFACAVDTQNRLGATSAVELTIAPPVSTGPSATTISAGAKLAGKIAAGGQETWFKFQAVAGTTYTIRTELGTLRDTVLRLYNGDGKTQLKWNDDNGSSLASSIKWTATQSGTYYFKVTGVDRRLTGTYNVSLAAGAGTLSAKSLEASPVESIGDDSPAFPMLSQKAAEAMQLSVAFADRISSDWTNFGGSAATSQVFDTFTTTSSINQNLIARHDTSVFMPNRGPSVPSLSLLDSNPALRSMLGSLLLDSPASSEPVQSLRISLDALDDLFARDELGV
jgi:subtilisin family serine protease